MPPTGNVTSVDEFSIEDDFKRATDLLINSSNQSRQINKKELGSSIFSKVPTDVLLDYVIKLIIHVHDGKKYQNFRLKNGLKLHHVVAQSFLIWLFALRKKNESTKTSNNDLKDGEAEDELIDGESVDCDVTCPFEFSIESKLKFVREIAMHDFPPRTLNFAAKVLVVPPVEIIKVVKTLADEGNANPASILSLISQNVFNTLPLWDIILQQYLLLNPVVTSTNIESYAASLSEENRDKVRQILLEIERNWLGTAEVHSQKFNEFTHRFGKPDPPFDVFRNNIIQLMKELKQQTPDSKFVDQKAALGVFRITCDRFKKKEVNEEQLLDLIYNIIKAKPQTRVKILSFLETNQLLKGHIDIIRRFNPIKTEIPANFEVVQMFGPRDNFLALPPEICVKHVTSPKQLKVIRFDLSKWENTVYPYVGLDAEWSPYLMRSKASVLQLALRDIVYIIDMDACSGSQELSDFLNYLFGNDNLVKVGFSFREDLHQLRGCSPNCESLYAPKRLICAQVLFNDLVRLTKRELGNLDGFLKPSNLVFEANPEIEQLEKELADPDFVEENPFRTPAVKESLLKDLIERDKLKKTELDSGIAQKEIKYMGLSAVCTRVLGKCLDKSEQCSVWDRRPLRPSQIRYAALDAYCLLMLMDRFIDWCKEKNLNLSNLIDSQPPVKIAFPLFFIM